MYKSDIIQQIEKISPEMVDIRRKIHAYPELAYEEERTSSLVAECLERWGYTVERGLGITGVVGQLRKGNGPARLGIRADMDALPIHEATGLPYASTIPGKMHACGHDGHTAILLCAARYLAESVNFNGTLNLIFQPAEENEGGAQRMIEDGLFEKYPCDQIFAFHNTPGLPVGQMAFSAGPAMAAFDTAVVTLSGKTAHGAMPHFGIDPMQCAASIILGLQTLVSREVDALKSAVITVGALNSGSVFNTVPDTAILKIGIRTLDPTVRETIGQRLQDFIQTQAKSYRLGCSIDYSQRYPVLVNAPEQTAVARQVAIALLGAENVHERNPMMGSEDFAFMMHEVPGAYLRLGNGLGDEGGCVTHTANYQFNDKAIPIGAAFWAQLTQTILSA
ncbi:amidohydrolase [Alcaligenaceae bacterium]|nr:amidohydrolase [Alcaligenaceae bacterium]